MTDEESLGSWLERRLIAVDDELAMHIRSAVPATAFSVSVVDGAEALGAAAATALEVLLARGCETRASAIDLLTVDALVTYACEVAADTDGDVAGRADLVLRQVGLVSHLRSATI